MKIKISKSNDFDDYQKLKISEVFNYLNLRGKFKHGI